MIFDRVQEHTCDRLSDTLRLLGIISNSECDDFQRRTRLILLEFNILE